MRIIFLSFLLVFMRLSVTSQVIYTDIIPDSTISVANSFFNLDLNGDEIYDFQIIKRVYTQYSSIDLKILNDSCYVSFYQVDACIYAKSFCPGDSIGDFSPWTDYFWYINLANWGESLCMHLGAFFNQSDKCVGLKLIKNGTTYYGWIRMDVSSFPFLCTLKDYAYDNYKIYAGLIPRTWTGAVSNDWNENGNWNPIGAPLLEDVHIVPGTPYLSIVQNNGMSCGNLVIEDGATLIILQGFQLNVHGKLLIKN